MSDIITPGESSLLDCPGLLGSHGYQVAAGGSAKLCLTDVTIGSGETWKAIFQPIGCPAEPTVTVDIEAGAGECSALVPVPDEVIDNPSIYQFNYAKIENDRPVSIKTGLLSVEQSLWNLAEGSAVAGPLSISEVRLQLRDAPGGTLIDGYEFSSEEIIHSIIRPIRHWNETPPTDFAGFSVRNFPFRSAWLDGIVSNLLSISAAFYMRQSRRITYSGGLTTDDRDKYPQYQQQANDLWNRYDRFVKTNKLSMIRNSGVQILSGARASGIQGYGFT